MMNASEGTTPEFYSIRHNLQGVESLFAEYMPNSVMVDVPETMRMMLADFFYADIIDCHGQYIEMFDRRIALLPNAFPPPEDHQEMMEAAGDIFWSLSDEITNNVLRINDDVNGVGTCRPSEAFYVYDGSNGDIMVYVPATQAYQLNGVPKMDGRSVWLATRNFWPKYLTDRLPSVQDSQPY